jgi:hypothetical protein
MMFKFLGYIKYKIIGSFFDISGKLSLKFKAQKFNVQLFCQIISFGIMQGYDQIHPVKQLKLIISKAL